MDFAPPPIFGARENVPSSNTVKGPTATSMMVIPLMLDELHERLGRLDPRIYETNILMAKTIVVSSRSDYHVVRIMVTVKLQR